MAELIGAFGIGTVVIVLLVAIPTLVNFITWCKGLWQKRTTFIAENVEKGRQKEKEEEAEEHRFQNGELRMSQTETNVSDLKKIIQKQQTQIDLLIESDKLNIKTWIKEQHEKWMPRKCIDSQTLELLCARYKLYTLEGGNSWAEKLYKELKALPVVTVVPISEIHEER